MALFGKKQEAGPLPTDRVRAMMRSGMSEKDIVRQLKAEGYSFGEIEKALMAAVKEGAAPLPPGSEMGFPPGPAQLPQPPARAPTPAAMPAPPAEFPAPAPAYRPSPAPSYAPSYPTYLPEEELQPEVIMEELVESVAEEKFEKFSGEIKGLRAEIEKLRVQLGDVRKAAEAKPAPELPRELSDRLDDFEGRLGGLEKAFKQIMPSVAENLDAISRLVMERKRQQMPPRPAGPSQQPMQQSAQLRPQRPQQ